MLRRKFTECIEKFLRTERDKILLVNGAWQVGKPFLIRYVGKKLYKNFVEINLKEDKETDHVFATSWRGKRRGYFTRTWAFVIGYRKEKRKISLVKIEFSFTSHYIKGINFKTAFDDAVKEYFGVKTDYYDWNN